MKRAIITAHYGNFRNENGEISERITLDDLMYYCLYWDKVIIPGNGHFYGNIPYEPDFINSGAVVRPIINRSASMSSSEINEVASLELIDAYKGFKENNPTFDFMIHHNVFNGFSNLKDDNLIEQQALRVELASLLPYPSNTNIQDLLEFKEKRTDELGDLHQHLTNLYLDIANTAHSQDLKKLQVISDFEKSLVNLNKSMNESFKDKLSFKNLISDLKSDCIELGAAAAADSALATFPSGTVVGGITIVTKRVLTTILKEQKTEIHLNYIKSSLKEGIVNQ
ncbi:MULTISPECIES: DUF6236 family protein [unclassified Acinetobacter]|uniref:DUF6236 family protein n=1 Tax=unclassified Acinetobacter TaxID=196816 RepID=UPI0018EE21D4|nr:MULTISPECIES: DUF6236 family protein [unclassified Acinetobacter]MBJ6351116.1 hypothetical protein [Acinetobacter sp. c1]MBM0956742.1 hypothetical protein [Acinetobacter sp. C13]